jgi:hypothetical protein
MVPQLLQSTDETHSNCFYLYMLSQLLEYRKADGVEVRDYPAGSGRGIFATRDLDEGDVIFRDFPLAALQAVRNRMHVLACDRCCKILASPEVQHARRVLANRVHQTVAHTTVESDASDAPATGSELISRIKETLG